MLLDVSKLIDSPGSALRFEHRVDLQDMLFGACRPVTEPVVCVGTVYNVAGVLLMRGTVSTTLHGLCDRCARAFVRGVSFPLDCVLVSELSNAEDAEQWTFLLTDAHADLDDIVTTAFVLNMDSKLLCKPDCKGLCCRCGKNLNDGPCACQPEPDSRFAVLKQLLNKEK